MKYTSFSKIPKFTSSPGYKVDYPLDRLHETITRLETQYGFDRDPDFQRPLVWTPQQQTTYVEYVIKGGLTGLDIYSNCVGWMRSFKGPFVLVDGKQRLNALLLFLSNKIKAFDSYCDEFDDDWVLRGISLRFHVHDLPTRAAVLQWYLELNSMGTPHTDDIQPKEVKDLLAAITLVRSGYASEQSLIQVFNKSILKKYNILTIS